MDGLCDTSRGSVGSRQDHGSASTRVARSSLREGQAAEWRVRLPWVRDTCKDEMELLCFAS